MNTMGERSEHCPPPERLEEFAALNEGGDGDSAVRVHVAGCAVCAGELERIRRNNDLLARYVTPSLAEGGEVTGVVPADAIPGYRLTREVHRGGQGVVYEAVQESTQRRVAVKVMREGPFAGAGDKARFDREVQILAQLHHPNIVTIHDSGQSGGHFYFVMDYIEGSPLDAHVRARRLSIAERLSLLARVCEAVNTAHLLGIVHRDLKPGNILIDGEGAPHILDFGLAKVASADAAGAMTVTGQFVGSVPWASPEQAEGMPGRIDVRTDVYSLGVVLYQLLTERFPYDVTGSLPEVLERIRRAEPARPSTVRRALNDELDTIALMCLHKEAGRRYATAGALGEDIRRYLAGEPIAAKRDSYFYVLRKQMQRYRVPLAVAGVFVVLLVAGLSTSLTFWRQAAEQRDAAQHARDDAEAARVEAEASRRNAEREARNAKQISNFFVNMLASADPEKDGREVTVRRVVENAAQGLEDQFKDAPEIESTIRLQIGVTLFQLGHFVESEPHFRRTLALNERHFGAEHEYTLRALSWLSYVLQRLNRLEEALVLQEKSLTLHLKTLGEEHEESWGAMNNLAILYSKVGRFDESIALYRRVIALITRVRGIEDTKALSSMNNLATELRELGRLDEAEELFTQALEVSRRVRGAENPRTLVMWSNYADLLHERGRDEEAAAMYREILPIIARVMGEAHPTALQFRQNFAVILRFLGAYEEAEALTRDVLAQRIAVYGAENADTALSKLEMGNLLAARGRHEEALVQLTDAWDTMLRTLGDDHWKSAMVEVSYGECLLDLGRAGEAEAAIAHACGVFRKHLSTGHRRVEHCEKALHRVREARLSGR